MSELLNQLKDEELDFTVRFTDTDGTYGEYEFLDIVLYKGCEYAVVSPSVVAGRAINISLILSLRGRSISVLIFKSVTLIPLSGSITPPKI